MIISLTHCPAIFLQPRPKAIANPKQTAPKKILKTVDTPDIPSCLSATVIEKMVMAYFKGYGCLKTFMMIDRDYNGESFCDGYYQDLMENIYNFFDPISKIPLIRNEGH